MTSERVAIVGSRTRLEAKPAVFRVVHGLPADVIVVSGGCRGIDVWAAQAARQRGLALVEHRPDLSGVRSRGESAGRYYARNQKIVDTCDRVVAFVSADRSGGTEDTIRRAERAGKAVTLL